MEAILTTVCKHINNYFIHSYERGKFIISDNAILIKTKPIVGQYIRIYGSALNDGIYKVTEVENASGGFSIDLEDSSDEEFEGVICLLAIPKEFINLVGEISEFMEEEKNDPSNPALTSESFGGYSYSRATASNGTAASWQEVFASKLSSYVNMYDRIMFLR